MFMKSNRLYIFFFNVIKHTCIGSYSYYCMSIQCRNIKHCFNIISRIFVSSIHSILLYDIKYYSSNHIKCFRHSVQKKSSQDNSSNLSIICDNNSLACCSVIFSIGIIIIHKNIKYYSNINCLSNIFTPK